MSETNNQNDNATQEPKKEEFDFSEIMRKNQEKKNKLKDERGKDNKGVIRSYRLK